MLFDLDELQKIIDIVKNSGVSEVEIKNKKGESIKVTTLAGSKNVDYSIFEKNLSISMLNNSQEIDKMKKNLTKDQAFSKSTVQKKKHSKIDYNPEEELMDYPDDAYVVRAPMVGTIYHAPSPNSPKFVEIGSKINKGDVLCIIEAMKMMNHIEADKSGVLIEYLTDNASPVEYDQPLFLIKTE